MMNDERYLTVEDAAAELQVHPETVRVWLRQGKLSGRRLGGTRAGWRIPRSAVLGLLEGTAAPAPVIRPPLAERHARARELLRQDAERRAASAEAS